MCTWSLSQTLCTDFMTYHLPLSKAWLLQSVRRPPPTEKISPHTLSPGSPHSLQSLGLDAFPPVTIC